MFEKRKKQDEIMEKLLTQLADTNLWVIDGLYYRFKDSALTIKWGEEYGYDSCTKYREINQPASMTIPIRYRSKVQQLLNKIEYRDLGGGVDQLEFLNEYLSGQYRYNMQIDKKDLSEMAIWMFDEGITEYTVIGTLIWFKNEEDGMASKLRWT